MLTKDIKPGKYYTARLTGRAGEIDTVRVERVDKPRYVGDIFRIVASRWQARGRFEAHFSAAQIVEEITPSDSFLRVAAVIETETGEITPAPPRAMIDDTEAQCVSEPRPKTWAEVTDDDIIAAVRFAAEGDRDDIARASSHVLQVLSSPTPEQWPTGGAHALYGLGLIPRFGEGAASSAKVTHRLKRLVREGRLEEVKMVRPRGKPAPPGYRVPS